MIKKICSVLILFFLFCSTIQSQSFKNLQGQYICEENGYFHLYEFKKKRLIVTLNYKNPFAVKHTIFYSVFKSKNQDSVFVNKTKHETERIIHLNAKDDKVSYNYNDVDEDYSSLWVLEKVEDEKLYITISPGKHTWFSGWKSKEDSNLIIDIILTPIN